MPESFYSALVIFLPIALVAYLLRRPLGIRLNAKKRVQKDIESRLFAESPTFVVEVLDINKNPGGFYEFRVEGLVANTTDSTVEMRIVQGTHNGKAFLNWNYQKPEPVDLKAQYTETYVKF